MKNFLKKAWLGIVLLSFIIVFILEVFGKYCRTSEKTEGYALSDEARKLQLIGEVYSDNGVLLFKGHLDGDVMSGEKVFLYLDLASLKVKVNNECVFEIDSSDDARWVKSVAKDVKATDEIEIEIRASKKNLAEKAYKELSESAYIGGELSVFSELMKKSTGQMIASLLIIFIGFGVLIVSMTYINKDLQKLRIYLYAAIFILFGGFTTLIRYEALVFYFEDPVKLMSVVYVLQALTCTSLILYIKNFFTDKNLENITTGIALVMCVLFMIIYKKSVDEYKTANELGGQFAQCFLVTFIAETVLIFLELKKKKTREMQYIAISSVVFYVTILIEFLIYVNKGYFINDIKILGLFIFASMQAGVVIHSAKKTREKATAAAKLEEELRKQQIRVMLSQVKPHFMYNSLGAISALCTTDPEKAKEALSYFSKYLRYNIDSLEERELVPFDTELDAVKNYLFIEKIRFESKLKIVYDIKIEDFMIPPMMLQSIVENAVRHGVTKKNEGGAIYISTFEDDEQIYVEVKDEGLGFDTELLQSIEIKDHVGIDNTDKRLQNICNGKLTVESTVGKGTTVTMIIPKQ